MKKEFYLSTAVHKLDESIKSGGYKPKSKFGDKCTSLVVEQELRECEAPGAIRNDRINEVTKKIEKELNSSNSDSEFFINCRDVTSKKTVAGWRLKEKIWNYQLGFLASLVNNVIKEEKSPPKENLSHLGYIGTQGKRGKLFVKLADKIQKDDYIIFKVVDPKGNRGYFYNYKTKPGIMESPLEVNDCFLMDATPARHEMSRYDSCKVTYFNRIVILENKGSNNSPKKSKPKKTWQEILAESDSSPDEIEAEEKFRNKMKEKNKEIAEAITDTDYTSGVERNYIKSEQMAKYIDESSKIG